jgi:UDPglucose 6-dehydrogenase
MRIAIVGQGYVGVTASACLAQAGHDVIGVESDPERLDLLRRGRSPVYEPGLAELLSEQAAAGRLAFRDSLAAVEGPVDAVLVAVGSPPLPSGGADLRQVASSLADIAAMEPLPGLIVVKSTVPPGTSERLLAEARPALCLKDRYVVSPEFLSLGSALADWRAPSRVVVGLHNESLLPGRRDLYRDIDAPWVVTAPTTAEMIKYASNAFLATKISFVNEIANLCDKVGGDVDDVVRGMALDSRIGSAHMRPGAGYGGSCFPKDTRALAHLSSLEGHSMPLLEAVTTVNNAQRLRLVRLVRDGLAEPRGLVAVLGLSFKPGTDDLRDAPSLTVVSELLALGYRVRVWDPVVSAEAARRAFPGAERVDRLETAVGGAHAAVVLTEWRELADAPWGALVRRMQGRRLVVDGRNCLDPGTLRACGADYRGIGRPAVHGGTVEVARDSGGVPALTGASLRV